eukprot:COSAG01_NODE_7501_length_3181_cov_3.156716_1_plen_391_part_10
MHTRSSGAVHSRAGTRRRDSDGAATARPPRKQVTRRSPVLTATQDQATLQRLLIEAAEEGRLDALDRVISLGANINHADSSGRTAMWFACWEGQLGVVQRLLTAGADAEQVDTELTSPFAVACENGQADVVRFLAQGRWCSLRSSSSSSSRRRGGTSAGESSSCTVDPERQDSDGCSPFFRACLGGQLEVVRYLAEELGVDPHRMDCEGNSPFMVACQEGHVDIVAYLTQCLGRADIERASSGGWTPFSCACFQVRPTITAVINAHIQPLAHSAPGNVNVVAEDPTGRADARVRPPRGGMFWLRFTYATPVIELDDDRRAAWASYVTSLPSAWTCSARTAEASHPSTPRAKKATWTWPASSHGRRASNRRSPAAPDRQCTTTIPPLMCRRG